MSIKKFIDHYSNSKDFTKKIKTITTVALLKSCHKLQQLSKISNNYIKAFHSPSLNNTEVSMQ